MFGSGSCRSSKVLLTNKLYEAALSCWFITVLALLFLVDILWPEDALNELGIYTFKQIAEWTPENVDWVEDFMSFPGRIEREDWIAQAKTLAEGGETEFSKRVDAGDVPSSQEDED